MIIPVIKHEIDVTGSPEKEDDFWVSICVSIGPAEELGADFFYFYVASPKFLLRTLEVNEVLCGRGVLILNTFDLLLIKKKINEIVKACIRPTWKEVAESINKYGIWEYDETDGFGTKND
ncbi:Imm8 family immunity protein [Brevibacillus nitrificans]|uniref:Imm8 family immunity protein n=1 Tax=Brevibacillus nitrificans TaxID=651560 RepID=UPI00261C0DAC|nr:Imm8 family immunity protein [Brevibacillus nitrificans]MED1795184.1 Imm8 family immunity protein [Brevibacillus nitrificans]